MATALLTADEELDLATRTQDGDRSAREQLVERHLPLAWKIARRYEGQGVDRADLRQEAVLGLMLAVDRFDPHAHDARFNTYAAYWVRKKIKEALYERHLIHIPHHSNELPIEIGEIRDVPGPLREAIGSDLERRELSHALRGDISRLDPRQMAVVVCFYGLDAARACSIDRIASAMGVSRATVERLHREAIDRLAEMSRRRRFPRTGPRAEYPSKCSPHLPESDRTHRGRRPVARFAGSNPA